MNLRFQICFAPATLERTRNLITAGRVDEARALLGETRALSESADVQMA
jgi:hypothetical protein